MTDVLIELFSSIVVLFQTLGGLIFFPLIALSIGIGIALRIRLPFRWKLSLLVVAAGLYFGWSATFITPFTHKPGEIAYVISGWDYTSVAKDYLLQNTALAELSGRLRNNALLKAFGANPDLIWQGSGLTAARVAGSACMMAVLAALTTLVPARPAG